MSWIQKLYETYDAACSVEKPGPRLWPLAHFLKKSHIEVVIDADGNFRRIRKLGHEEASTLIPVTEASVGRAGAKVAPHPLCDEISYCAPDFPEQIESKHQAYIDNLNAWCVSAHSHPKAVAVLAYIRQKRLWSDLNNEKLIPFVADGAPGKPKQKVKDSKIFIRWQIESPGNVASGTWEDETLIDAWIAYDRSANPNNGLCMVWGNHDRICNNHPKFIRRSDDGAKLISANDSSGFVFRGRFTDDTGLQACGVGYEVTQKAHNALRWLIQRQAYRNEDQVIVSWAVGGTPIPDPLGDSYTLMLAGLEADSSTEATLDGDAGQAFANRLNMKLAGYRAQLGPTDDIVVMALDSATPGRMAITYYRELTGSEFLDRIEHWHSTYAWPQNFSKDKKFIGAPAPQDVAEAAFGRRLDSKLKKATIERLLPCIIDGQPPPRDLIGSTVRRACNRVGLEHWEWEKVLGIACALYRGAFNKEGYTMALETDRTSRDYLYGRLLAIAEHIESRALFVAGEKRDTAAAKLMQRFADRPASTWRTIELALSPAKSRLRTKRAGFMHEMDKLHDEVVATFTGDAFLDDRKLSGEFLLGYHCQRQALNPPKADITTDNDETPNE
jgi:CRISPR-associated protein Csd1